jgi:hypothetical protein
MDIWLVVGIAIAASVVVSVLFANHRPRSLNSTDPRIDTLLNQQRQLTQRLDDLEYRLGRVLEQLQMESLMSDRPSSDRPFVSHGTTYLRLESIPAQNKIAAIKVIREITGLGLKDAKEIIESTPTVITRLRVDVALAKMKLEAIGARVSMQA